MNSTRRKQIFIAFETIVRKEIIRFVRIWSQTLLPPVITMTLYFLIFGKLIGSQIQHINGYTYMQYIVPGLVMMAVMTNSYVNTYL
jgi:ABC-2 type transport system permease protein